jgi:hypothetical protein
MLHPAPCHLVSAVAWSFQNLLGIADINKSIPIWLEGSVSDASVTERLEYWSSHLVLGSI